MFWLLVVKHKAPIMHIPFIEQQFIIAPRQSFKFAHNGGNTVVIWYSGFLPPSKRHPAGWLVTPNCPLNVRLNGCLSLWAPWRPVQRVPRLSHNISWDWLRLGICFLARKSLVPIVRCYPSGNNKGQQTEKKTCPETSKRLTFPLGSCRELLGMLHKSKQ